MLFCQPKLAETEGWGIDVWMFEGGGGGGIAIIVAWRYPNVQAIKDKYKS